MAEWLNDTGAQPREARASPRARARRARRRRRAFRTASRSCTPRSTTRSSRSRTRRATSCPGLRPAASGSRARARGRRSPRSSPPPTPPTIAQEHGVRSVDVRVTGPGAGRESAIRALQASGIDIKSIKDVDADPAQRLPAAQAAAGLSDSRRRLCEPSALVCKPTSGPGREEGRKRTRDPRRLYHWLDIVNRFAGSAGGKG